jgi:hypothetical protein
MRNYVVIAVAIAFVISAHAQDGSSQPLKIKGVFLGQPVTDFLENSEAKDRFAQFDTTRCSKAKRSDRNICETLARAAAGEKVTFSLMPELPGSTTFDHGVVVEHVQLILGTISDGLNGPFDKVLYDLKQRLGVPKDTTPIVMQNGFGATFSYRSASWMIGDPAHSEFVVATEHRLDDGLKVVLVSLSNRTENDHQKELAQRPSTID